MGKSRLTVGYASPLSVVIVVLSLSGCPRGRTGTGPRPIPQTPCQRAEADSELATRLATSGRANEALVRFAEAELTCPRESTKEALIALLVRLYEAAERDGRLESARFFATAAARLQPTRERLIALAWVQRKMGALRRAQVLFTRLAGSADGEEARRFGDVASKIAAELAEDAKRLRDEDAVKAAREAYGRGRDAAAAGDDEKARQEFLAAHRLLPDPECLMWLGRIAQKLGDRKSANEAYARAVALLERREGETPRLRVIDEPSGPVRSLQFTADGRYLLSAGHLGVVHIWDLKAGQLVRAVSGHGTETGVEALALDGSGKLLLSGGSDGTLALYDFPSGRRRRLIRAHDDGVRAVAFGPGETIASASGDGTVAVYNRRTGMPIMSLSAHRDVVTDVSFHPSQRFFVSASRDGRLIRWSAKGDQLDTRKVGALQVVAFRPDGAALLGAGARGLGLWRVGPADKPWPVRWLRGGGTQTAAAAFAPDGSMATVGHDARVYLWSATGRLQRTLRGHENRLLAVAFAPSRPVLASGGFDRAIRLWDRRTGRLLGRIYARGPKEWIVYTPDGYFDVARGAGQLVGWQVGKSLRFHRAMRWERFRVPNLLGKLMSGDSKFRLSALRRVLARTAPLLPPPAGPHKEAPHRRNPRPHRRPSVAPRAALPSPLRS